MRARSAALTSASALTFGLLTWTVAHAFTYLLFAQLHHDVAVVHLHGGPGVAAFAAAGCLATVALAAVVPRALAAAARRRGAGELPGGPGATVAAPALFLLVEWVQHQIVGDGGPPVALLVIGLVVHAAMGALTPVLWSEFTGRTAGRLAVAQVAAGSGPSSERIPVVAGYRSSRRVTPAGVRGPPPPLGTSCTQRLA